MQIKKITVSKVKKHKNMQIDFANAEIHSINKIKIVHASNFIEGSIGSRIIIGLTDDKPIFDREEWPNNVFSR